MFENSDKIRITLQQNTQGVHDRFLQFQTGVTQRFTMEDQKFSRRFVEVYEKIHESQKAMETNLHHFQTDFVQKITLEKIKNSHRTAETQGQIKTCQLGLQKLLLGQE